MRAQSSWSAIPNVGAILVIALLFERANTRFAPTHGNRRAPLSRLETSVGERASH